MKNKCIYKKKNFTRKKKFNNTIKLFLNEVIYLYKIKLILNL